MFSCDTYYYKYLNKSKSFKNGGINIVRNIGQHWETNCAGYPIECPLNCSGTTNGARKKIPRGKMVNHLMNECTNTKIACALCDKLFCGHDKLSKHYFDTSIALDVFNRCHHLNFLYHTKIAVNENENEKEKEKTREIHSNIFQSEKWNDSLIIPNGFVYICNKCGHRNLITSINSNSNSLKTEKSDPICEYCQRDKSLDQQQNARYVRFFQTHKKIIKIVKRLQD